MKVAKRDEEVPIGMFYLTKIRDPAGNELQSFKLESNTLTIELLELLALERI